MYKTLIILGVISRLATFRQKPWATGNNTEVQLVLCSSWLRRVRTAKRAARSELSVSGGDWYVSGSHCSSRMH